MLTPDALTNDATGRFVSWKNGGDDFYTRFDVSGKAKAESQFAKARWLLETKLAHGALPAVEIMQLADEEGISFKTFKRVKDALGVISIKRNGQWYWDLPIDVVYEECSQEEGQGANVSLLPVIVS
ncbi:MAG: hypothetical protein LBT36_04705 [Oscillospiraceae bacterium]|nr:hypothetical protein [Oscillospiraceae bacterium]